MKFLCDIDSFILNLGVISFWPLPLIYVYRWVSSYYLSVKRNLKKKECVYGYVNLHSKL